MGVCHRGVSTQRRTVSILGSTGSIGRSALDVVRSYPDLFQVEALAAHANIDLLEAQIHEFHPRCIVVSDEAAARTLTGRGHKVHSGPAALEEAARIPVNVVLCAMVGAAGLLPLLAAIDAGNSVAIANKEPVVMAGALIMERARERGVEVLPVDSEHSAIFQCLQGANPASVQCVHLTASGGPFYGRPQETLREITPEQATRHPTWDMGAKISVDSATLMNKGLEIIEAMWLFNLAPAQIEVVIHPQSIIHSIVEFTDGNMLAHLGVTDMRFPILFALSYPKRVKSPLKRLDLTALQALTFAPPAFDAFPCLGYARNAAEEGGTAPAVLNAANEVAVEAFCQRRLPFLAISEVVRRVREKCAPVNEYTLETIVEADAQARRVAAETVSALGS